jgi:hypothetical protein
MVEGTPSALRITNVFEVSWYNTVSVPLRAFLVSVTAGGFLAKLEALAKYSAIAANIELNLGSLI